MHFNLNGRHTNFGRLVCFTLALVVGLLASENCRGAAFVPDVDRIILAIGQDVNSVSNYIAATGSVPGGIMSYTSTARAEGLTSPTNYGAGLVYAQYFTGNPAFNQTVIQLGLYIDNDLQNIVSGARDGNLNIIGNWIKSAARPVYLRIGYEFDGPWNALPPAQYVAAYQYIVNNLRGQGVTNAAFVWHSCCGPAFGNNPISAWYPGDSYVDWAGISVFQQFAGTLGTVSDLDHFCAFAKAHNKPIMIAESTPYGGISDARWANWFQPCLELIHRHHIQMWSYINTAWDSQSIFAGQGWGDSEIQNCPLVESNWLALMSDACFLKQSAELLPRLHNDATNQYCEAEAAALSGVSVSADAFASGGQAVTGLSGPGSFVMFTNNSAAMQFVLRYTAASLGTVGLYVNSEPRRSLPLAPTGALSGQGAYRDALVHAAIPAGATVKFQFDAGDVALNVDAILFRGYADTDGDGLPDDWELWRLGTLAYGANDDPDHDGLSNYGEFVADTDPLNSKSTLPFSSVAASGGAVFANMQLAGSRDTFVQQSADMKN